MIQSHKINPQNVDIVKVILSLPTKFSPYAWPRNWTYISIFKKHNHLPTMFDIIGTRFFLLIHTCKFLYNFSLGLHNLFSPCKTESSANLNFIFTTKKLLDYYIS